jgi:hypothetical protein
VAIEPVLVVSPADIGSTFVVTEVVACANAVPAVSAQAAPMEKILANVLSFMLVLCFVKRMLRVVISFDLAATGFIQPQRWFVNSALGGRIPAYHCHTLSLLP